MLSAFVVLVSWRLRDGVFGAVLGADDGTDGGADEEANELL